MAVKKKTLRRGAARTSRSARRPELAARSAEPRSSSARAQPLIAVRDVISSSRWYCSLLGARNLGGGSDHADVYDRLYSGESLVLQLHSWDDEEHTNLISEDRPPGHGVLVWFEVDDFDAAVERARELEAEVVEEPHVNEAARHREIWLRDPDGYVVVLASPDGEAAA